MARRGKPENLVRPDLKSGTTTSFIQRDSEWECRSGWSPEKTWRHVLFEITDAITHTCTHTHTHLFLQLIFSPYKSVQALLSPEFPVLWPSPRQQQPEAFRYTHTHAHALTHMQCSTTWGHSYRVVKPHLKIIADDRWTIERSTVCFCCIILLLNHFMKIYVSVIISGVIHLLPFSRNIVPVLVKLLKD